MKLGVIRWVALASLLGCPSEQKTAAKPAPARPIERFKPLALELDGGQVVDNTFAIKPLEPKGGDVPADATVISLRGEHRGEGTLPAKVLLVPDADTFLVQVAPLLAALDDAGAEVWLKHPDAELAYRVRLRDEPTFGAWLDEASPGKVRVIHRTDGFELQTNMGKLPGFDPNGPSVPLRGGHYDLTLLQQGLERVKGRFKDAKDVCFLPSFGMEMANVARALATNWLSNEELVFSQTCLVYPRPKPPDAGR